MNKPKEILEIEQRLKIQMSEVKMRWRIASLENSNTYLLDSSGGVIGLNLTHNQIQDISFLQGLTNLQILNLSRNKIQDISFLQELTNLQSLDLRVNQIQNISFLQKLINLQSLNLNVNRIQIISFLEGLTNLEILNLKANRIQIISFFQGLASLESLDLSNNQVRDISLKELISLQNLDLSNNQVEDISLKGLISLQNLDLSNNQIQDICLKELINLQNLNLSHNQIYYISLQKLTNLQSIDLSHNQVTNISSLANLTNLININLSHNKINDISALKEVNKYLLKSIDIQHNKIETYPLFLLGKIGKKRITGNPLKHPPMGIIRQGEHAILKYFEDLEKKGIEPLETIVEDNTQTISNPSQNLYLHEAKLIFIGNGEVGKSSIRTKLMDREAALPKYSTHGIDTFEWIIKVEHEGEDIDFKLNIWDFGGQGEYRAIQQFFCTRNSIYVYVTSYDDQEINNRDEYVGFDYWYPFVQAYGYNQDAAHFSPLLHIRNKKETKVLPIDEKKYKNLYPNIYSEYLQVSCKTGENLDRLADVIKMVLPKASYDMFTRQYPLSWMQAKEELEKLRKLTYNYISLQEYQKICQDKGMDLEAAAIWLKELETIGTVIYFGKNKRLENLVIINPEWIKEAAYRVLKKQSIRKNYGEFRDFSEVWQGGLFPKELYPELEELMLSFEICYQGRDDRNKPAFYAPALFPPRTAAEETIFAEIIEEHELEGHLYEFIFKYDLYMPAGLLHKIIVRNSKQTQSKYKWRDCSILLLNGTYAEIVENWKEKQLEIKIKGKNPGTLYRFIKGTIDKIGQELIESKFIKPLTYHIAAFYEGDYESIKSLRKMAEAREIFSFLFEHEKRKEEGVKNTTPQITKEMFQQQLNDLLNTNQQNAIATILTQIKDSNYEYDRVRYTEINNQMNPTSLSTMAHALVESTKTLINSLK